MSRIDTTLTTSPSLTRVAEVTLELSNATRHAFRRLWALLPQSLSVGARQNAKEYDNFTWYGRGPWENYSDRKHSSFVGVYSGKVADQYYPYIRPQESGNKTDVRWAELTDKDGFGIRVVGEGLLNVSALDVTPEALDPGMDKQCDR